MARIRVTHDYRGFNTGERSIWPGEYDSADPKLFGLAHYLLDNGHAVAVEAGDVPPTEAVVESETVEDTVIEMVTEPDYAAWPVDELEGYAKAVGIYESIEGSGANGNVLKADLIAAVEAHEAE